MNNNLYITFEAPGGSNSGQSVGGYTQRQHLLAASLRVCNHNSGMVSVVGIRILSDSKDPKATTSEVEGCTRLLPALYLATEAEKKEPDTADKMWRSPESSMRFLCSQQTHIWSA